MPTIKDTDAGYFISKEPVKRFDAFDCKELAAALEQSLSKSNEIIAADPMPPKELLIAP